MSEEQKIVIIAGPNGAGKTTFAREFLVREADCPFFVNADLIAAGLSPFTPAQAAFRAGRLMIRVARGGHNVDESVIRRRFDKGWNNFHNIYKKLVDAWVLYDNSGESPQLIDEGKNR